MVQWHDKNLILFITDQKAVAYHAPHVATCAYNV